MAPGIRFGRFVSSGSGSPWRTRLPVTNDGPRPVRLLAALAPHRQFRSAETPIDRELDPGSSTEIEFDVSFAEPPGGFVENSFFILRVREGTAEWRLLARVRVTADDRGRPVPGSDVVVTAQPVDADTTR